MPTTGHGHAQRPWYQHTAAATTAVILSRYVVHGLGYQRTSTSCTLVFRTRYMVYIVFQDVFGMSSNAWYTTDAECSMLMYPGLDVWASFCYQYNCTLKSKCSFYWLQCCVWLFIRSFIYPSSIYLLKKTKNEFWNIYLWYHTQHQCKTYQVRSSSQRAPCCLPLLLDLSR